jgi:hypothetical protein
MNFFETILPLTDDSIPTQVADARRVVLLG